MKIIYGTGASGGIAAGKLHILRNPRETVPEDARCADPVAETARLHAALDQAGDELDRLYGEAVRRVGEHEAEIFGIHKMILTDEDFVDRTEAYIRNESRTAAEAVRRTGEALAEAFRAMDDAYLNARAADVLAVAGRVTDILSGSERSVTVTQPSVLAAHDLTPAETVTLDRNNILGFVTEGGSTLSHTAILARTMNLPAVIGVGEIPPEYDGCAVVLDGNEGVLYLEPDEVTETRYVRAMREAEEERERLERYRGKPCILPGGTRIHVTANVGSLADIDEAIRCDAEGIGLFRSEFLFMGRTRPPTEDEQYELYRQAAIRSQGRECVIRTLDVGADKNIPYLTGDLREANPALGLRGVRLCLRQPDLLKTQFRALYRAALSGNLAAMIPMIVVPEELRRVREIARAAQDSLTAENVPFGKMRVGIMIETPAAAVTADLLAPMTDFFSVGTNDLMQYTLAADRENPDVAYLTREMPESVRRLIRSVCAAAKVEGIPVSVCGELAGDVRETKFLLDAGVTKLSVAAGQVLRVKESVTDVRYANMR